jgi:cell wall-associated NlpC family hydrolase
MQQRPASSDIVAEARGYLGVRWRHQGRSRNGIDCAGLVIQVAKSFGSTFDTNNYTRRTADELMVSLCREHLTEIPRSEVAPGDVMVFGLGDSRHMGIVGNYQHGGLSLIHAYLAARKVVETRIDEQWRARARGCFRFPGV